MEKLRCDRREFIDCVTGNLMIRDKRGAITHLGDTQNAHKCVLEHEKGAEIVLTIDGKDFSVMRDYEEHRL